jgi:predicted Zn-dependent protease
MTLGQLILSKDHEGSQPMNRAEREKLFRRGLALCRRGELSDANVVFDELLRSGTEEPLHLSYAGLLTATAGGDRKTGLRLCERAFCFGTDEPDVVMNLTRVYLSVGRRSKAIKALRRGLRKTPKHPAMLTLINELSPRADPPLSMVDRNNAINKSMAILLAKLSGRFGRERAEASSGRSAVHAR